MHVRWSSTAPSGSRAGCVGSPAVAGRQWVERTSSAYVDDFGATTPPPVVTA